MIDKTEITVISGNGGDGAISGRREKFVPLGGPDGGRGGKGGSVFLICDKNINTLSKFQRKHKFVAGNGGHGKGRMKHGPDGEDIRVKVPEGTEVWDQGDHGGKISDLTEHGQTIRVARGGSGGRGNPSFTTSRNRFALLAEKGEEGQAIDLKLELKLLADVGIVGSPNVGKSSLLRAVSSAKPKVAEYPFTTLEPVLGVVEHKYQSFVMVDIPGLIEGASSGKGLGGEFLQHIERTKVILHLLDGTSEDLEGEYRRIKSEMALFNKELSKKREIVAVNKMDIAAVNDNFRELQSILGTEAEVHHVSALSNLGLGSLINKVIEVLAEVGAPRKNKRKLPEIDTLPILRTDRLEPKIEVRRVGERFVVKAQPAERIAGMVDRNNWHAILQLREYMKKTGVMAAIEDAGVNPGDVVRIGSLDLTWE